MRIHVITVFPNLLRGPLNESIIKRSQEKKLVEIVIHDLRNYSLDKHRRVDDYPYGGSPGMILKPEPIFRCIETVIKKHQIANPYIIYLTPQGQRYSQLKAIDLSKRDEIILFYPL